MILNKMIDIPLGNGHHRSLRHAIFTGQMLQEQRGWNLSAMASRLLMDGGGFAIAIGLALGAVAFASRLAASGVMRHR